MADYKDIRVGDRITRVYNDGRVEYRSAGTGKALSNEAGTNVNVGAWSKKGGFTGALGGTGLVNRAAGLGTGALRSFADFTGGSNIINAVGAARRGDWRRAGMESLAAAGDIGSMYLGLRAPGGLISKTVAKTPLAWAAQPFLRTGAAQLGGQMATSFAANRLLDAFTGDNKAVQAAGTSMPTSAAAFRMAEQGNKQLERTKTNTGGTGGGGGGAGVAAGAATSPSTNLPGLSASEIAQFDAARRTAQSQYENIMNEINRSRREGSMATQEQMRQAGRSATGQTQDLGSYLAEMGYSSAPAQLGIGEAAIAEQEAASRSAANRAFADLQAQLGGRAMDQETARMLALAQILGAEQTARANKSRDMFMRAYGG